MLNKIRRYYRDNKAKVWKTIAVIVFIFIAIRFLDYLARVNREERDNSMGINTVSNRTESQNNTAYLPSEAVISDTTLSEEETSQEIALIEDFINKCNNNQVEEAYNLLSTDCKEQVFPTLESFYNNYYAKIFTQKMSYDAEAWIAHYDVTYRIEIMEDILSSGRVSEEAFEDYYTIVEENDTKKINLNNFVRATEMDDQVESDGIQINVVKKYEYIDYEEYEIQVTNQNDFPITLDTKEHTDTVYIDDENGVQYTWQGNEIDTNALTLQPNESKVFRIKFNKMYSKTRLTNNMYFTNIIKEDGSNEEIELSINI